MATPFFTQGSVQHVGRDFGTAINRAYAKKQRKTRLIRVLAITGIGALVVGGTATVLLVRNDRKAKRKNG